MLYARMVEAYEAISGTTKRREMTATLVELLQETPPELVHEVVYLTQGKLYPDYEGVELGMAEKLAVRAVAEAAALPEQDVQRAVASTGDLGAAAERLLRDGETGAEQDDQDRSVGRSSQSSHPVH